MAEIAASITFVTGFSPSPFYGLFNIIAGDNTEGYGFFNFKG